MEKRDYLDKILSIPNAILDKPIKERGGFYSKQLNVWMQADLDKAIADYDEETLDALDVFARIALAIGALYKKQIEDVNKSIIWPKKYFENHCEVFRQEINTNQNLKDPFAVIDKDGKSIPYSIHYKDELEELIEALKHAAKSQNSKTLNIMPYINRAIDAYKPDTERNSDIEKYRELNKVWVTTPSDSPYLIFAEPTEVYLDPLRVTAGQYDEVSKWAEQAESEQGLPPWKNFFEFRLMERRGDMVTQEETAVVRENSSKMFGSENSKNVPVSLEFRQLLFASGQGSYPAKTAKNYPNFKDIRQNTGYKNVLYSNMLQMGTVTETIPVMKAHLGSSPVLEEDDIESRITRGRALLTVAHEENHPHRRMSSIPLEELKATVNGLTSLLNIGNLSDTDTQNVIWALVGTSFIARDKTVNARKNKDKNSERAMESYYVADTIITNWLDQQDCFLYTDSYVGFYESKIGSAIKELTNTLDEVRTGRTSSEDFYKQYNNEEIWKKFK